MAAQYRVSVSLSKELGAAVERLAASQWSTPSSFCRYAIASAVAARQSAQAASDYVPPRTRRRGKLERQTAAA
jgi:predicted transcriptional regulator